MSKFAFAIFQNQRIGFMIRISFLLFLTEPETSGPIRIFLEVHVRLQHGVSRRALRRQSGLGAVAMENINQAKHESMYLSAIRIFSKQRALLRAPNCTKAVTEVTAWSQ